MGSAQTAAWCVCVCYSWLDYERLLACKVGVAKARGMTVSIWSAAFDTKERNNKTKKHAFPTSLRPVLTNKNRTGMKEKNLNKRGNKSHYHSILIHVFSVCLNQIRVLF